MIQLIWNWINLIAFPKKSLMLLHTGFMGLGVEVGGCVTWTLYTIKWRMLTEKDVMGHVLMSIFLFVFNWNVSQAEKRCLTTGLLRKTLLLTRGMWHELRALSSCTFNQFLGADRRRAVDDSHRFATIMTQLMSCKKQLRAGSTDVCWCALVCWCREAENFQGSVDQAKGCNWMSGAAFGSF